jgi:membrane protease YdiL (CAAX protease family)
VSDPDCPDLVGPVPPDASPPVTTPPVTRSDDPFWGWHDLFLFLFITILALGFALLVASGIRHLFHLSEERMNIVLVLSQFAAYGISFTCLKLMFRAEYDEPLLKSLRWTPVQSMPSTLALVGLGQAFAIAIIGSLLRVPQIENPMTRLMSDRATSLVIAALGVTAAPIAEELAFRGLLQPLMVRLMGVVPGILTTGILFGFMHLEQYGSWQSVLLVGLAGVGFGVMRHFTGSTRASTIMHAGYNSALFIVFFSQKGPPH